MSRTPARGLDDTITDERLRPFLPLIYTAWSDGELTDEEMKGICAAVAVFRGIDQDCQQALARWLNPEIPPTPIELESLRRQIATWAATFDSSPAASAVDLGIALAEVTRASGPVTDQERAALEEIDSRVGPLQSGRALFGPPTPLAPIEIRAPAFTIEEMTAVLDGRFRPIRAKMRELLARPEFSYPEQPDRDRYRELVLSWNKLLAAEGIGSLGYPAPYGNGDMASFVVAFAMLGHHDLSLLTKFGVQFGLFGGCIARLGTERHHQRYLADVGALRLPGCFAMTETAHGSDARSLETTATYDPVTDEIEVTTPRDLARKDYIGNAAAHGRLAVVFARLIVDETDHGVHAVLVPIRADDGSLASGIRIEDNRGKGGLNGVDNGRIWFDRVTVPRENLLDRFASIDEYGTYRSDIPNPDRRFFTMIGMLVGGRVSVGAASVTVAKSALTIAIRYAHRRRQFEVVPGTGTLIIDYPLHQLRLIPRLAATYAYHFAFEELIDDYANSRTDQRALEANAAGLKAYASWHAIDTVQAAREACGGQGFLEDNRLTVMRADADIFTTYEGDNTVLTQLVAKALLSDFRQSFESMSATGLIRFLARRAGETAVEASSVVFSSTDPGQLLDPSWQLAQLQRRVRHQVEALARRIKKRIDSGMEPSEAFTEVQDHAASTARSHVDHRLLETFVSAVDDMDPGPVHDALDRLRALHGLATLRGDGRWFQEHNQMSGSTVSAISHAYHRLVPEVARDSLALVDSFAIPDQILAAPIAV